MKSIFMKKLNDIVYVVFALAFSVGLSACNNENKTTMTKQYITQPSDRLAKVEQNVERLLLKMTLAEKVSLAHASGKFHVNAIKRLGIPEMWLSDGPHGVRHQIERHT
ncbi:MAG: glycosyl hydrolase, partial [Colwellia sp.]